jgi:membrane protein involved in colicin uptake
VNENGEHDIGDRVYADQDEQHRTYECEEEHKRKREKRRRVKEEAKKKSKAEADERDKKEKDKKAKEFASREPKFFAKRQERDASYDSGVEDFTKFESENVEFARDLYAEQKRTYSMKS